MLMKIKSHKQLVEEASLEIESLTFRQRPSQLCKDIARETREARKKTRNTSS